MPFDGVGVNVCMHDLMFVLVVILPPQSSILHVLPLFALRTTSESLIDKLVFLGVSNSKQTVLTPFSG